MLSIGKAAKASGCKVQTIRYYEQIGLIQEATRSDGNQRFYKESDIDRLQFIRHARSLGFSTDVIKQLLQLNDHQELSCSEVDVLARQQLVLIKQQIKQLQSLAKELNGMITQCEGNNVANCKILQTLQDHSHCSDHKPLTLEADGPKSK